VSQKTCHRRWPYIRS